MNTDPQSDVKASAESTGQKSLRRRFLHWIVGLLVAGVAAALTPFITGQLQPLVDSTSAWLADIKCQLGSTTPKEDDKRLLVLISPLAGDDSKATQTDRLLGAFRGQDVNAYTACERIAFDPHKDKDSSQREVAHASTALLKKYGADLLIFGEVGLADKAARVWLVNETGGCEEQPTPIVFENGFPPPSAGLAPKISEKIFGAMLSAVLAACKATQTDWKGLEHRTRKVGLYLQRASNSNKSSATSSAIWAYATALKLLYQNEDRKEWYETSTAFNLDQANRVFAQDPKNRALWLAMQADIEAERYDKSKDEAVFDAAIGYINEAITSHADAEYYMERGRMFHRGKQDALAISDFSTVIRLQPKKTDAFIERGKARRFNGQLDAAIADFNVAISHDPKDGEAFLERGVAWRDKGQYETAIKDYDIAIQLAPDSALAYASRGYVLSTFLDAPLKALSDFDRAIELEPGNAVSLANRADALSALGQTDRALADLNEAIKLEANDVKSYTLRGVVYFELRRYEEAASDFGNTVVLAPHYPYGHLWRYLSQSAAGHGPNASITLSSGYSKIDQNVWPAAIFQLLLDRLGAAEVLKLAGDTSDPADRRGRLCEAQFYLGEYHGIAGREAEAIQHFQNARDSCPHDFKEYGMAIAELKRMAK